MLFTAPQYALFLKDLVPKDLQPTYQRYYENGMEAMKMSVLNELIQTHRVNPNVTTALLKALSLVCEVDKGENEQSGR
eukprot:CAMPEP_0202979136 /NCGR_PEP_ID=MMETSP1396-20130829/85365_1 /ASSEMBLY_ACC=CAM_ASM_000872 /TAXON_ID= /ORGANISM="Pseudokeronopsis sp., Strain Brazil" /LENGTH=77 /DNA_ID=CAMNT_0049718419 /DNA_START=595 /DNA_END=828 /DNA_ORIENTATION=+